MRRRDSATARGGSGATQRRHIKASGVLFIGKEANRWEEQLYLGEDPVAQIVYGQPEQDVRRQLLCVQEAIGRYGVRRLARETGLSLELLSGILGGTKRLTARSARCLSEALGRLEDSESMESDA